MSVLVKKYLLNTIREVILEEESAEFKQELRNKMKRHDWAYEWSDDSRYHRAGRESESIIIGLLSKLPPEESKELWSMYAPKNMPFPERRIYNKPKLPPQKLSQREQKIGKEKLKFQESNDQQQKIEEIYTRAIKSAGVSEVAFDQMFADHVLRRMSYNEIVDILSEVIKSFERLKEEAPPGREKQVKRLKKELPKTYTDPKTGKRKESNPWAVSWSSYNKGK